ncbi:hypothetical protein HPP05_00605 [Corallococcus exiguus]|uniref:hypothetical protein n=1 Tax=Corallococcus exiguus TaxID=83462 RepID=UPI0013150668|nr:hypothetical protein [Corallococcus exiguus]NPC68248.1 hypothetical protein [Corallococcus exiguus]
MRIVAVADTHLFHDELVMPPGDIFVPAGDMCRGIAHRMGAWNGRQHPRRSMTAETSRP